MTAASHAARGGWWPAALLALVALVDRIETSLVAGVLPLLQAEWGFGDTAAGLIPAAVAVTGVLVALPAGYVADRARRTRVMATVVAVWSIVSVGSALAPAFAVFFASRIVLGAADSLDTPIASSLLADFYGPERRAKAYGIHRLAFFAGIPLGVLTGGVVGDLFGWRSAFVVVAVPGLLVAWGVWRLVEPVRGSHDPDELVAAGSGLKAALGQLGRIASLRTLRFIYPGLGSLFFGLSGIFFWLPSFFERTYGLREAGAAGLTALITLVGVSGGTAVGALLGDRWHAVRAGWRVTLGGAGLLVGAAVLAAGLGVEALGARTALLTAGVWSLAIAIPNLNAAIADVLPPADRGTGFAVLQLVITVGFAAGPLAVGALSDLTGSLRSALAVLVIPVLAGAVTVLAGRRSYAGELSHDDLRSS